MRSIFSLLFSICFTLSSSAQDISGNVLFWTAQNWECDFLEIKVYNSDSVIVETGKLKDRHTSIEMPDCGSDKVLNFENLPVSNYFFVADCKREACTVCNGEGSFWQHTVQDQVNSRNERKNKGQIGGTYKTCHVCGGNGQAFQILWIDTFSVQLDKCRTILLN